MKLLLDCAKMFWVVLPLFPKFDFVWPPPAARPPKVKPPPDWHEWEELEEGGLFRCSKCFLVSFDSEARPMNGCSGPSAALRRLEGAETERRRRFGFAVLRETRKPLFFCTRCGAYTSRRCHLLGQMCLGTPGTSGEGAIKRIRDGLHPH